MEAASARQSTVDRAKARRAATHRQERSKKPAAPSAALSSVGSRDGQWPGLHGWGIRGFGWRALAALAGGLALRLWMLGAFPQADGDALLYGNLAQGILRGQFAIADGSGVWHATLIRLPGYPLFLAACFRGFGVANWHAVAYVQIALELAACLLLADFVRRIASPRAALNTLWLAAMCPFTAVYASAPLTESLTFDAICLALWSLERYRSRPGSPSARPADSGWGWLLAFTFAIGGAAMLRPDGALVAVALWPALLFSRGAQPFAPALRRALLCALLALVPFAAWTVRNWQVFHVFEPLAPRYANNPGEDSHPGFQHWIKTWCLDFTCTQEIYWNMPDSPAAFDDLPALAFDSPRQQEQTAELFSDYNADQQITPALDARFEALAQERAAAHPLRTDLLLPLGRLADMALRPRVENLTIDLRWWQFRLHRAETEFSVAYGIVNLLFLGLGLAGFWCRPRFWQYMAAYLVLRSLLLLTLEAPETRYTLEFFPFLFATGGIALERLFSRRARNRPLLAPLP